MRVLVKIFIFMAVFCVLNNACFAKSTKIIVAPLSMQTVNSTAGIYPNISDHIASDIINELNKNLLFDVTDLQSTENMIMAQGIWEDYRRFLRNYKDRRVIDYRVCDLLKQRLGIDRIMLVSSGFSMQDMIMKKSWLSKLGFRESENIESYYKLNIGITSIDTQSGIISYERSYNKDFKVKNFEVVSNSMSDNILSTAEIKTLSAQIADEALIDVASDTTTPSYTHVRSSVVSEPNTAFISRDGTMAKDGHPTFGKVSNTNHTQSKRENSFKNWVKDEISF